MKNIIKTLGVMLASISLLAVSAKAGELAVSGTAKATLQHLSRKCNW